MMRSKSVLTDPKILLGFVAGIAPFAGTAGAVVTYGNFTGTDVTYTNVEETPTVLPGPSPTELFGAPVISGDTLAFTPVNFDVGVSGGSVEFADGRLTTGLVLNPGSAIQTVNIFEGGGWGVAGGTSATTALETLVVNQLFITSVNGVAVNPIVVTPTITFTDTDSGSAKVTTSLNTIEFSSSGGLSTGSWNADASFNVPAALAGAGLTGTVTGLELDLNNQLAVDSEANSTSFIDKKFFDITTGGTVPEPATISGMVLAAGGLLARRRRIAKA